MFPPLCLLFLLVLLGCTGRGGMFGPETDVQTSRIPAPVGFPLTTQPTLESAQHWQQAAVAVAQGVRHTYESISPDRSIPIFVAPMGTTAFAKNFHTFLMGELNRHGLPVRAAPEGAMILEAATEVVQHRWKEERDALREVVEPGFISKKDERDRYLELSVVREDRALYTRFAPPTEMILTATLYHGQALVFQTSTVFYILPEERSLYLKGPAIPPSPLKHYILVE